MLLAVTEAFDVPGALALSGAGIATHAALAVALLALSALTTRFMLERVRIMDHPTARSAHRTAMPKAGGLSVVLTFRVGVAVLYLADPTRIRQG